MIDRGKRTRNVGSALGSITVKRIYFTCRECGIGNHPLDARWGVRGSYSDHAERLIVLAGADSSFDRAVERLGDFCGWTVSDTTIRAVCDRRSRAMMTWRREAFEASRPFRQAVGELEFTTDGTMVNTTDGWREMRLGAFVKRPLGEPATADQWDTRELPEPTARFAFAAIESSAKFAGHWTPRAVALGIADPSKLTVLADGARWIWEETAKHFAGATAVLDIYHALQHISETASIIYGEATAEGRGWTAAMRTILLAEGWPGVGSHLGATRQSLERPASREAVEKLERYLGRQPEHLRYAERLASGRSIGSGQIEGACRHMIGKRLKNGGRWKVRRANRMANLCAVIYSGQWDAYWKKSA